ncbi:MAG: FAD-dependent oxidoreductase, partial [Pirellulaceae bacterium]
MAKQRVMIVGGGLAGLGAAMKLAESGIEVDLM